MSDETQSKLIELCHVNSNYVREAVYLADILTDDRLSHTLNYRLPDEPVTRSIEEFDAVIQFADILQTAFGEVPPIAVLGKQEFDDSTKYYAEEIYEGLGNGEFINIYLPTQEGSPRFVADHVVQHLEEMGVQYADANVRFFSHPAEILLSDPDEIKIWYLDDQVVTGMQIHARFFEFLNEFKKSHPRVTMDELAKAFHIKLLAGPITEDGNPYNSRIPFSQFPQLNVETYYGVPVSDWRNYILSLGHIDICPILSTYCPADTFLNRILTLAQGELLRQEVDIDVTQIPLLHIVKEYKEGRS